MFKTTDESARVAAVKAAYRQLLAPRLEEDTRQQRVAGRVFYRGRWMSQSEATRIFYLLKRDSERMFFDVLVVLVLFLALYVVAFRFAPAIMSRLL